MSSKMAARDLFYAQGSSSYGDSKGAKFKKFTKKIVFPSSGLVYGDQVFSDEAKNSTILNRN